MERKDARAGFFGWLRGKRPAAAPAPAGPAEPEPAPSPVAPAAPPPSTSAPSTSAPPRARKRRAAPGEWNRGLPQDARMWAIVAADFGGIVRRRLALVRTYGEEYAAAIEDDLLFDVRAAATCARMVLGDVKPPRPFVRNPSPVIGESPFSPEHCGASFVDARMRKLDERERARAKGPRFDMSWPEWFAVRFPAAFIVDWTDFDDWKRRGEEVERK